MWVGELRLCQAGLSTILLAAVWPWAAPSPSLGLSSSSEVKVHTWRLEEGERREAAGWGLKTKGPRKGVPQQGGWSQSGACRD